MFHCRLSVNDTDHKLDGFLKLEKINIMMKLIKQHHRDIVVYICQSDNNDTPINIPLTAIYDSSKKTWLHAYWDIQKTLVYYINYNSNAGY